VSGEAVALLLGWAAAICVLAMNLPQVWRSRVRGLTEGVPASRAWVAMAVGLVWLGYGLAGGGAVQVVLNVVLLAVNAVLLSALVPDVNRAVPGVALLVGSALATAGLGAAGGMQAIGAVGALAATVLYLPQALALRTPGAAEGVSSLSLQLQLLSGLLWIGYGGLRAETVVWLPNLVVVGVSLWTLMLLQRDRRTSLALVPLSA
jgi:uncharacterized protein with PQ loop repeat